jgi:glucose-1-phosphate thymidylyltransferase
MQGLILAGGKGKRLHPLTQHRSKAMAPVAGKPMVARVVDLLVQNGICDLLLIVSPADALIADYFAEHCPPAVTIRCLPQVQQLGMAHALQLAAPYLHDHFVLSACDNLVEPDHLAQLIATHVARQANATLSLMPIALEKASTTGVIAWAAGEQAGWIAHIVEKPKPEEAPSNISSLPLYVFSRRLLDYLPQVQPSARGEYELQDAMQLLIAQAGRVTGVLTAQRWQITTVDDLLALNRYFLEQAAASAAPRQAVQVGAGSQLIQPVCIEAGSVIGENCVIGPHVYIESSAQIGHGARLVNALVLRNAIVAAGQLVYDEVIV